MRNKFDLRDHGVAVRRGSVMASIVAPHPQTGKEYIYLGYNTASSCFVVQVDPVTGQCRQFDAEPGCWSPWGMMATPDGRILVTSVNGFISALDVVTGTFRVLAKAAAWLWNITRGSDGKYYLAGNAPHHLHRFDLATGQLENLGSISATQTIARMVVGSDDGYVYITTGTAQPQVLAYHIATGKLTSLLPRAEESWIPFHGLSRGPDGGIYVHCNSGHCYQLVANRARRIKHPAQPGLRLTDGTPVIYRDPDEVQVGKQVWPVTYTMAGTGIFHLAVGPRNAVYGSTIMPMYLFRYDPRRKQPECLGRGGQDNGEAYSLGHVDGKLYYATYPSGHLLRYDPTQPWAPGLRVVTNNEYSGGGELAEKWDKNPRLVTALGTGHCRPRAMVVDSQKRIWIGSHAEYGRETGGLACFDTVKAKHENYPAVISQQSITALTADDTGAVVYGGTDISRGSGLTPVTKEARLFAWDVKQRKLQWDLVPVPGHTGVLNLLHHAGKLYGTTDQGGFFIYDLTKHRIEQVILSPFGPARPQSMAFGADGNIYGITWMALFRWRPNGKLELLWKVIGRAAQPYGGSLFHRGAAIIKDRLYFSCNCNVMSVRLPLK